MRTGLVLVSIVAVSLATWALRDAAVAVWLSAQSSGPPLLVQGDPRVALVALEADFLPDGVPSKYNALQLKSLAKVVLRQAPLEPSAIRDLALASEQTGDPASAGDLLLAERVSRRDLPTQNALLREAAQNGQYAHAIAHLDRMLTVFPDMAPQFIDAMVALVDEPEGRRILAGYSGRPWFPPFITEAIARTKAPRNTAALLLRSRSLPVEAREAIGRGQLERLLTSGNYDAAREFAVRYAGATPAMLDNIKLSAATADPRWAPLSWQLTPNMTSDATIAPDGLRVAIGSGAHDVVMQRVTLLSPGAYWFEQRIGATPAYNLPQLTWELSCQQRSVIWSQSTPLGRKSMLYRSHVEIPADCPLQVWRFKAALDEVEEPVTVHIFEIDLKPG